VIVLAALLALLLAPLLSLVWASFQEALPAQGDALQLGLHHYRQAGDADDLLGATVNSIRFAFSSALLAIALGASTAWLAERTQLPLRRALSLAMLMPLFIPGVLYSFAWVLLGSPRIGLLNQAFARPVLSIYGHSGMAWVEGLHAAPLVFLLSTALLRSLDPQREQAARLAGASLRQTFSRITLPVLLPVLGSAFVLVLVRAAGTFEVPAMLGLPAGVDVLSSRIFRALRDNPGDTGPASAYATLLLLLSLLLIFLYQRWGRPEHDLASHQFAPGLHTRLALGPWKWPLGVLSALLASIIAWLPLAALLWSSLLTHYQTPDRANWSSLLGQLSLSGYQQVLSSGVVRSAAWQTLQLASLAATLIMLAGLVAAWAIDRQSARHAGWIEPAMHSVLALPGMVLGMALLLLHTQWPGGLYGTVWLLVLAFVTRFLPYGLRYGRSALAQVPRELESAALCHGASTLQTWFRITLPLLLPGLLAGWLYVLTMSARELSSALLLYTPGKEVITVVFWQFWENGQIMQLSALSVLFLLSLSLLAALANHLLERYR
jgi:iron(III) transport system permease protein